MKYQRFHVRCIGSNPNNQSITKMFIYKRSDDAPTQPTIMWCFTSQCILGMFGIVVYSATRFDSKRDPDIQETEMLQLLLCHCTLCALANLIFVLKYQRDQAIEDVERISLTGNRLERELQTIYDNTLYLPGTHSDIIGTNRSSQLAFARRNNELPLTYLRFQDPIMIVRQPITVTVTLAAM